MWLAIIALLAPGIAAAQPGTSPAVRESRSIAERNHLGLLEYCHQQGFVGEDAITLQRHVVDSLPPTNGADVEAEGRKGVIAFEVAQATFAQSAAAQGITIKFSCEQTALRVLRQEAGR